MPKLSKETKFQKVNQAVLETLRLEGSDISNTEVLEQAEKISQALMLVEQTLWYRLTDDKKVANLILKYQHTIPLAMTLIQNHGFENLVYTFRSLYTNLYEVHTNIGRHYNLSKKDYEEFLNKVNSGEILVKVKPLQKVKAPRQPKVAKAKTVTPTQTTSFLSGMLKGNTVQPKVEAKVSTTKVVKPVKTLTYPQPKVETVKPSVTQELKTSFLGNLVKPVGQAQSPKTVTTSNSGSWVKVDMNSEMSSMTFCKTILKDKTKLFAKFVKVYEVNGNKTVLFQVNSGEQYEVLVSDIQEVYVYVKGGK